MGRRSKEEAEAILSARDFGALEAWVSRSRGALRTLFSLTYNADDLISWRAVEAAGRAAAAIAAYDLEKVRVFIRGLVWLMTEESGGIGWYAPQTIAEVVLNVPSLRAEYAHLLPQYAEEESFEQGVFLALARLAPHDPALAGRAVELAPDDSRAVEWYDFEKGTIMNSTVAEIVRSLKGEGTN
jgi:hypothetical protein